MSKHTPEPWHYDPAIEIRYDSQTGKPYERRMDWILSGEITVASVFRADFLEADALRIVACVNALAGIEDPEKTIPELRKLAAFAAEAVTEKDHPDYLAVRKTLIGIAELEARP